MPAVILSKKRRHIITTFRQAGATSSKNSKSIESLGLSKSLILEIQKLKGIVIEVDQNRFYLDEIREKEITRFRRIFVMVLLMLITLIVWYFNKG